jgi:hypothetical protein
VGVCLLSSFLCGCATPSATSCGSKDEIVYSVSLPLSDVNAKIEQMAADLHLVLGKKKTTGVDGAFEMSSANGSVMIVTLAIDDNHSTITLIPGTVVTDTPGSSSHEGDPRFKLDLMRALCIKMRQMFGAALSPMRSNTSTLP